MNRENMDMAGLILGHGACPCCGDATVAIKVNAKGHLYAYCASPADGGCGGGTQSRSATADAKLAGRITKWAKPEYRARFKPADMPPTVSQQAENEQHAEEETPPPVAAVQAADKPSSWFDKPLWGSHAE